MTDRLRGRPAAPGVAVAPVWTWRPEAPAPTGAPTKVSLEEAVASAVEELEAVAARIRALGREEDAAILEAQALMAEDPSLVSAAQARIAAGTEPVEAVRAAGEDLAAQLASLSDPTLAARAADVRDVAARIGRILAGHAVSFPDRPSIAFADDLPPSITAEIPAGLLVGIALAGGSPTAHAAILARSLGIPAVVGVDGLSAHLGGDAGERIAAVDGETGEVLIDPEPADLERLAARAAAAAVVAAEPPTPLVLADGRRVPLLANIGRPDEATAAIEAGAEGVGLFRTEFLFLGRHRPPTEDEQVAAYRAVFEAFGPDRPVVVRLADIGGDKEVPYLGLPPEANPFLGVRALRLGRDHRALLVGQLRAVIRAGTASAVTLHVMAPMVATLADVDLLDDLVAEARASAGEGGGGPLKVGIMIEVPAAVVLIRELARRVDFVSIGTNDLTQYLMAADRTNAALADYQDATHPAVLRSIQSVVEGAHEAGIPVAVCGELAGDPAGARLLVGLGVDELSMGARSLARVAAAIRGASTAELAAEADAAVSGRGT